MNKVIDNLSCMNNHYIKLQELLSQSTDVIIASPFLMRDIYTFLSEVELSKLTSFKLITTLKPKSSDQIRKVNSFISFIDFFEKNFPNISYSININNRLHGKVYIFRNGTDYIGGIITSANFTDSGLRANHEWGMEIYEEAVLKKLEKDVESTIQYPNMTVDKVLEMLLEVDDYLESPNFKENEDISLDLTKLLPEQAKKKLRFEGRQFWLKPIGVSEAPIDEGEVFSKVVQRLEFSNRRPSGVNIGDIIIAYGVGTTKVLAIYEVASLPLRATNVEITNEPWRERWPWSVKGNNLTPDYGSKWWKYDLTLSTLSVEYQNISTDGILTFVGGKTLGGLRYGSDKLRLKQEFADFIIKKVISSD